MIADWDLCSNTLLWTKQTGHPPGKTRMIRRRTPCNPSWHLNPLTTFCFYSNNFGNRLLYRTHSRGNILQTINIWDWIHVHQGSVHKREKMIRNRGVIDSVWQSIQERTLIWKEWDDGQRMDGNKKKRRGEYVKNDKQKIIFYGFTSLFRTYRSFKYCLGTWRKVSVPPLLCSIKNKGSNRVRC